VSQFKDRGIVNQYPHQAFPVCRRSELPGQLIMLRVFVSLFLTAAIAACGGGGGSGASTGTPPFTAAPSALSYAGPQTYAVGTTITALNPTVTGAVASYSVSPALPAGLSLHATSGQISGTPSAVTSNTSYMITATNNGGSASFNWSATVIAALFNLEPTTRTLIASGQAISLFATLKNSSADPFPIYIDPAQVAWSSSQPGFAVVNSSGVVTGIAEGTTVISAQYLAHSNQVTVQVSGTFVSRNVIVPGQGTRKYSIYTPAFGANTSPHPAILAMHGGGGTAMLQAASSTLNKFAQEQLVYVAYLEGSGAIQTFNAGNCCGFAQTQNLDDVAYVSKVLDDVQSNFNVNAAKIYATGLSNGGMMSHRLACSLSDRFAAIAAIAGASGQFDRSLNSYYACNPTRRIPILHIHAVNDRNYPYAGGTGDGISASDYYPVDSTIADWIARNNVTNQASIENVTATTTCYRYSTVADVSKSSAPVTLCKLTPPDIYDATTEIVYGGGHSWPGGVRSPSPKSDAPVTDFSANAYMWSFFNR
jgi:polyhydroxybutyrate depolymerase